MKTKTLALIVLPLAMAYATSGFAEKGEEIKWSQVPTTVQKTISENMGGGKIEVRKPGSSGKKIEIEVDEKGKLIELEDE
jgi:hypothetical protein